MNTKPRPTKIVLHQTSRLLELEFDDGSHFELSCEYLRVYSPSAEVRGHGPGQEVLQYGKQGVGINGIDPQGAYAVRLSFDDGHDTGIYSWETLYELAINYDEYWASYLLRLEQAGKKRGSSVGEIPVIVRAPSNGNAKH